MNGEQKIMPQQKVQQKYRKYTFIYNGKVPVYRHLREILNEELFLRFMNVQKKAFITKVVPSCYVWNRNDGFELLLSGNRALHDFGPTLDAVANALEKNDPMLSRFERKEGNFGVLYGKPYRAQVSSLVVTRKDDDKTRFQNDRERHIAYVIAKSFKRHAVALGLLERFIHIDCKIHSYQVLPDFYPVPFSKEKQSVVHATFSLDTHFYGIWQIGYFSRYGYGRVFKKFDSSEDCEKKLPEKI